MLDNVRVQVVVVVLYCTYYFSVSFFFPNAQEFMVVLCSIAGEIGTDLVWFGLVNITGAENPGWV